MQYKQLIAAVAVVASSAATAAAYAHGLYDEYNGMPIRYRQLGPDAFAGIPADQWNDTIHTKIDDPWEHDVNNLTARSYDVSLHDRNLNTMCKTVFQCSVSGAKATGNLLIKGIHPFIQLANSAAVRGGYAGLVAFLNTPFISTAVGVGIGGTISYVVTGQKKNNKAQGAEDLGQCSTQKTEADVLHNAYAKALDTHPDATGVEVKVSLKDGEWTIQMWTTQSNPKGLVPVCKKY
ncbi:hypothetical protein F5Y05DRAFT_334759 [Hypoxylon sp. FL0543]|nr:hypothetical protein F5Y05DRAFT_334759 [Hypoxylon sp. FL0543]